MLRKTYLVHIAASLRHGGLYGKKLYDLPSGSAVGSVGSWVHVDILESHWGMVQLSETISHRESKPTAHYRCLKSKRQTHFCLLCHLPVHNLKEKVSFISLSDVSCRQGKQRAHHGKAEEHRSVPHIYKKESLKGNSVVPSEILANRSYLPQLNLKCQTCFEAPWLLYNNSLGNDGTSSYESQNKDRKIVSTLNSKVRQEYLILSGQLGEQAFVSSMKAARKSDENLTWGKQRYRIPLTPSGNVMKN